MDSSNAFMHPVDDGLIAAVPQAPEDSRPAAVLRGTARGLEIVVQGKATVDAIALAIMTRLDEAPGFFRGSDVRVRVEDGPLPTGCLARLDDIAGRFELRIVEVTAAKTAADGDAVPKPSFAAGSAPTTGFEEEPTHTAATAYVAPPAPPAPPVLPVLPVLASAEPMTLSEAELPPVLETAEERSLFVEEVATQTAAPLALAATAEIELETITNGTRLVVGPVRSGVILEHKGHLVVFGDVNPGAEIRAQGNIVVLGRLRGTAHAGIGQDIGFIMALRLEPQQLRIGRMVARAGDSDRPASEAEIAYGTGDGIVVERYLGKLPRNLATSI